MADMKDINKKVRTLLRELLGMPANTIRPANQNAPTGDDGDQFGTVLLTVISPTGQDDLQRVNEGGESLNVTETTIGQRAVMASVNIYRGDAFSKASRLPALLGKSYAIERMQALGLGLVGTSQPRNLSAVVNTLWEERGQIDITFHVIDSETDSVQTYGTFPVEVSTADANGDTTTQAFEVFEP